MNKYQKLVTKITLPTSIGLVAVYLLMETSLNTSNDQLFRTLSAWMLVATSLVVAGSIYGFLKCSGALRALNILAILAGVLLAVQLIAIITI